MKLEKVIVDAPVLDESNDVWVRPGVWVRRDTHDLASAREVDSIVAFLAPTADDIVLDVGGHIGAFSRRCAQRGARVVTVEPEPSNCALIRLNAPTTQLVEAAVTDGATDVVTLWTNPAGHTGLHTLARTAGRTPIEVPAVSFRELLEEVQPTLLKIDIEGGEWLLDFSELPRRIRKLHIEYHMRPERWRGRELGPALHRAFIAQDFNCTRTPNFTVKWGTYGAYSRDAFEENGQ